MCGATHPENELLEILFRHLGILVRAIVNCVMRMGRENGEKSGAPNVSGLWGLGGGKGKMWKRGKKEKKRRALPLFFGMAHMRCKVNCKK